MRDAAVRFWSTLGVFLAVVAVMAFCSACDLFMFEPPAGTVEMHPPIEYRHVFGDVVACSGRWRSFGAVRWWVVPAGSVDEEGRVWGHGGQVAGLWRSPADIFMASDFVEGYPRAVGHELLHYVTQEEDHDARVWDVCYDARVVTLARRSG